jgi:hypothetical protein
LSLLAYDAKAVRALLASLTIAQLADQRTVGVYRLVTHVLGSSAAAGDDRRRQVLSEVMQHAAAFLRRKRSELKLAARAAAAAAAANTDGFSMAQLVREHNVLSLRCFSEAGLRSWSDVIRLTRRGRTVLQSSDTADGTPVVADCQHALFLVEVIELLSLRLRIVGWLIENRWLVVNPCTGTAHHRLHHNQATKVEEEEHRRLHLAMSSLLVDCLVRLQCENALVAQVRAHFAAASERSRSGRRDASSLCAGRSACERR